MSIRYEWVRATDALPEIITRGHYPDGEPVPEDPMDRSPFHDAVTADFALAIGDGTVLVIEGSLDELAGFLRDCLDRLNQHREN